MDPVSQGIVGAAAAQLCLARKGPRRVWLYGALGGMAPDLDVLIRSTSDPLLHLEYHRHFTHGLAFSPLGGLLVALPFLWKKEGGKLKQRAEAKWILMACVIGYATHGLLDLCTSYGTVVLWPMTEKRFALDWISIVEPIFTLPLCVGVFLAQRRSQLRYSLAAVILSFGYLLLGAYQHSRGVDAQQQLAAYRATEAVHGRVMPSLASIRTWRSVYQYVDQTGQTRLQADVIQTPLLGATRIIEGGTIRALDVQAESNWTQNSQVRRDLNRFRFFADGLLAQVPEEPSLVGDMRYSIDPAAFQPLWGLRVGEQDGEPRLTFVRRDSQQDPGKLMERLWNQPSGVLLSELVSTGASRAP